MKAIMKSVGVTLDSRDTLRGLLAWPHFLINIKAGRTIVLWTTLVFAPSISTAKNINVVFVVVLSLEGRVELRV
jgi:hypothetical protein